MELYSLENPVFVTYVIAAALMAIKIMAQGWMTVYRMMKVNAGYASPEDAQAGAYNRKPDPSQLSVNDYVDRSRRMHRNDLENIPAFFAAGFVFVAIAPALWLAQLLMYGFVVARLIHAVFYATAQSHEVRSIPYSIGSLIVIYMAAHTLVVVVSTYGFG